ncbi:MAG: DUF4189 domain-containing protein [Beijerinckiaceae bacterium]
MLAILMIVLAGFAGIRAQPDGAGDVLPLPVVEQAQPPAARPQLAQAPAPTPPPVTPTPAPTPAPVIATPPPAAPPAASAPPSPADAAAVREELQLWTQIKDSKTPEEFEAFLLAYPNGRLAPLARRRIVEIRAGAARPAQAPPAQPAPVQSLMAPPAAPSAPQETIVITRAIITEVQERLYGLNYYSGPINGNYGKLTGEAIVQFRQRVGMPVSAEIDTALVQRLRAARGVTTWGALAFSARGAWGASWQKPTRKAAEDEAMAQCRRAARTSCKIVPTPGTACTALAVYDVRGRNGRRFWGAYVATRPTREESRDGALEYCRRESPSADACQISTMICGDKGQQI